ncbi:MAG: TfoX/Sxy family DNA transformation protein [Pseudomonadota bacterium]
MGNAKSDERPTQRVKNSTRSASAQGDFYGLGPFSLRVLSAAGIATRAQLDKVGPLAAFIAAKAVEPKVTLNLLWALAGALTGKHWTRLPADYRSTLLLEYDAYCDQRRQLDGSSNKSLQRTRSKSSAKLRSRRARR